MKVLLIDKNNIYKIILPEDINDYWIVDKSSKLEQKLMKINSNNNKLEIISNNYAKLINPQYINFFNSNSSIKNIKEDNLFLNKTILKNNKIYPIYISNCKKIKILYCYDDNIKDYSNYSIINTNEITIGTDERNHIIYKNDYVSNIHAKIHKYRGTWFIENYNNNFGTFVNNISVYNNPKKIFNGDVIFIMGLKIIILNDTIYINNPENTVQINKKYFLPTKKENNIVITKQCDDDETRENEQIDYFIEKPRIKKLIQKQKIKIDPPPKLNNNTDKPVFLMLGSSIAMAIIMIITSLTTIQNAANGTVSISEIVISIITILAMLVGILLIPVLNVKYDKKSSEKYEKKRKTRYKEYLNKKMDVINKFKLKNKSYYYENYLSAEECQKIILKKDSRLWERDLEDKDFLSIRLGIGNVPSNIEISYLEEGFLMEDDELLDDLNKVVSDSKTIKNVPLTLSLLEKNISAITSKDENFLNKFIKNIIVQLIALHNYTNLKIVFLLNKNTSLKWNYVKMLPHVWDNSKQIRFFADNYNDIAEISKYLQEQLDMRLNSKNNYKTNDNNVFRPYYLIITDDYNSIHNLEFFQNICIEKENKGFSLLCVANNLYGLPKKCKVFVEIDRDAGKIYDNTIPNEEPQTFKTDPLNIFFFEKINQTLANTQIMVNSKDTTLLPNSYNFLEMYNVGNIDQLNIIERWKNNDTTMSLKAPIGIDSDQNVIFLDAHENYHGPHGLIAGSTGSGKSEFIITYILSLAINYHPDDVTFLLIDYKGGGLSGAFQNNKIKLPHLVGAITNIDRNDLQRSFISIQSELRRRQILFNEARDATEGGTIDIYKYQKLYHNGIVNEPIPHLFLICDEFAELKQQQQDFMDELMSVSRIGRSLGIHLILATQKPAGVVNDQIRSNSKFAVCLRVNDISDSIDILNKPDGAYLTNPGQFYMQVANNKYFVLGQSRLGRCNIFS